MFFVLLFFGVLGFSTAEDELLAVSLIYRHGDRTPIFFAPNDPYKDSPQWPTLPGELTNEGKRQHYELGKWLRSRYDGFLSSIYNKGEIYVRSSDVDRCIMSAEANLASLYRPQGKDVWTDDVPWQPIPVHAIPMDLDDIAEVESACPRFPSLLKEAQELPQFQLVLKENAELIEFLQNKTGADLSSLLNMWYLYDTFFIEDKYQFAVPSWAIDALPKMREMSNAAVSLYTSDSKTIRLCVGRFYDEVLKQFQAILSSDSTNHKFKAYSAHDTQIFSVLNAIAIENLEIPPYAALVAYELRKPKEGSPYVQILYKKEDVVDVVKIPNCDLKCGIDSFGAILESIIISKEDYDVECRTKMS